MLHHLALNDAAIMALPAPPRACRGGIPFADDAELLDLGRQWQESMARQHALNTRCNEACRASDGHEDGELEREFDAEVEAGSAIMQKIAGKQATTPAGIRMKALVVFLARRDGNEVPTDDALVMSLVGDLLSPRALDAELLALGQRFEAAWAEEAACWRALPCGPDVKKKERKRREDLACAAADSASAIVQQILHVPATTIAGLVVKARACSWTHSAEMFDDDFFDEEACTDQRLAASVMRDLLAIDGRSLPAMKRTA